MKKLGLLMCVLALSGCSWFSGEDDIAITPAELVDFTAEVSIERIWSVSVGSGAKDYLISLRPAASRDTIFAADYSGQVTALELTSGKKMWEVNLDAMITGGVGNGWDIDGYRRAPLWLDNISTLLFMLVDGREKQEQYQRAILGFCSDWLVRLYSWPDPKYVPCSKGCRYHYVSVGLYGIGVFRIICLCPYHPKKS